jgi:uncharacterized membrane protein YfcA
MELYIIMLLCLAAFFAGFVDAVVGGGGLIQTPVALVLLPHLTVSTVIGSLKIPSFSGTALAARQYLKAVKLDWNLVLIMALVAVVSAFMGSELLTVMDNQFMKPLLLVVLSLIAVYTFLKKDFGSHQSKEHSPIKQMVLAITLCMFIGFYDGFIGPGTGSFFVLGFVAVLGFDFLKASATAKVVNLATNMGSISLFLLKGKIIWSLALPMAACNAIGGWVGAKLALKKGNSFIRVFFMLVVLGTLLRFAYDVFIR